MATVKVYAQQMQDRQLIIARKFGCDLSRVSKPERVLNLALLILVGALIKTLTDKGVITDAELLATLNAARDDVYPDDPEPPG